jgi:hypothetical protein
MSRPWAATNAEPTFTTIAITPSPADASILHILHEGVTR